MRTANYLDSATETLTVSELSTPRKFISLVFSHPKLNCLVPQFWNHQDRNLHLDGSAAESLDSIKAIALLTNINTGHVEAIDQDWYDLNDIVDIL